MEALSQLSLPPGAGVGIDLVQISRFEDLQHDSRFLERIFSSEELAAIGDGVNRMARLAARWAAKEACAKALGCGIGEALSWKEMRVERNPAGKPSIFLTDAAATRHHDPDLHLSLSHDGEYAIAIVWIPASNSTPNNPDSE